MILSPTTMGMAVSDTRERIVQAALRSFLEEGYEQTTTAQICARAGVSNGALFHHFASKQAIADALYVEAIASFQGGLWALLESRPATLSAALHGAIGHQLSWIEAHADLARFVYMRGHLDWESAAGSEVAVLNSELAAGLRAWMRPLVEAGHMRSLSIVLVTALVSGPAHAIARRWLSGHLEARPTDFVAELAEAACAALRPSRHASRPAAPKLSGPPSPPLTGRLRLELLDEDGLVVASGQASAQLAGTEITAGGGGRQGRSQATGINQEDGQPGRGSDR